MRAISKDIPAFIKVDGTTMVVCECCGGLCDAHKNNTKVLITDIYGEEYYEYPGCWQCCGSGCRACNNTGVRSLQETLKRKQTQLQNTLTEVKALEDRLNKLQNYINLLQEAL